MFTGLVALSFDFFLVGVPVFALERLHTPDWVPGAILAVVTVIDGTCGTVAVRLTRRLSRPGAMMAGAALYLAWCVASSFAVVVPAAWQPGWLLAAALLLAAGTLMFMPRANALSEAAAPVAARGRYLAAFQFSFTIPGIAAPALVGLFAMASRRGRRRGGIGRTSLADAQAANACDPRQDTGQRLTAHGRRRISSQE